MDNIKIRLNFSDVLFLTTMTLVLSFSNSPNIKAVVILAFFAYMLLLHCMSKNKGISILHFFWAISFFLICYFSKKWAEYPQAIDEQINNVIWSILLSLSCAMYITYYRLTITEITKRMCFIACLFLINVLLNGVFIENRLSVSINENIFGKIASGITCFLLFFCKKQNWKNPFYDLLLGVMVIVSLLSGSRKVIISLLLFTILFLFLEKPPKNFTRFLGIIFGLIVICVIGYFCVMNVGFLYDTIGVRIQSLFDFIGGDATADSSTNTRLNMMDKAIAMFHEKPLLGFGLNNFKYLSGYDTYAHSNYYELLACLGLVGFIIYYLPFILFFIEALKLWKSKEANSIVPLAILLVFLVNDFASVSYFSVVDHVFLGIAIGMIGTLKRLKKEKKQLLKRKIGMQESYI